MRQKFGPIKLRWFNVVWDDHSDPRLLKVAAINKRLSHSSN